MTKISIQQLASLIPDSIFGSDEETKTAFVRLVFETISSRLADGESVDVPGLGRFQCTGDAANPLLFDQDKTFAQTVNAPFASFRPEPLAAEVTESMLEETAPAVEGVAEAAVAVEEPDEPSAVVVAEPETPAVEEVTVVEEQSSIQGPKVEETASAAVMTGPADEPVSAPQETTPAPEQATPAYTPEPVYEDEPAVNEEEPDTEIAAAELSTGNSRFSSGFFCGFIAGLAVGAIAFLVYIIIDINRPSPTETEVEEEITETEQMVDSLSILME